MKIMFIITNYEIIKIDKYITNHKRRLTNYY